MRSLDWPYLWSLLFRPDFWRAAGVVIVLATLAWTSATLLGLVLAVGRQWRWTWLKWLVGTYVWLFRSMPLLVLIVLVYNVPILMPSLEPVLGNPFWSGLIALVLSETAYITEIHRGAMLSVGSDQREAAAALGISYGQSMRRVVIPQAFRIALPGLGNQLVAIVKLTSLVSVISLAELLTTGERLYTQNFKVLETLLGVSIFYVLLVTIFSLLQSRVENRVDVRQRKTELVDDPDGPGSQAGERHSLELSKRRDVPRHEKPVVVRARGVTKKFGDVLALDGVDFDVHAGEVVTLVGTSGSGKSTFLRTFNGLEGKDGGTIEIVGSPTNTMTGQPNLSAGDRNLAGKKVGMVFQHFNLFPHLSVIENLMLAPRLHGERDSQALRQRCLELLHRVGMDRFERRYPYQLSGGQQQRVAIARALAMEPTIMLFDEPTSALDPELVGEVLDVMTELAAGGMTMIVVTHEMRFVRGVADWVVLMDSGQVVEQGTPDDLITSPRDERTARFFALETQGV